MKAMHQKPVLAIDTLTDVLSASILYDGNIYNLSMPSRKHANAITELIQALCHQADITVKDLTALVINIGPGSFTGLRIGISTIQALSHALDIPILPLSHTLILAYQALLTCLATAQPVPQALAPMIDAKLSQVYFSLYGYDPSSRLLTPMITDTVCGYADLPDVPERFIHGQETLYTCGEAWQIFSSSVPANWRIQSFIDSAIDEADHQPLSIPSRCVSMPFYSRSQVLIGIFLHTIDSHDSLLIPANQLIANYVRHDIANKQSK